MGTRCVEEEEDDSWVGRKLLPVAWRERISSSLELGVKKTYKEGTTWGKVLDGQDLQGRHDVGQLVGVQDLQGRHDAGELKLTEVLS